MFGLRGTELLLILLVLLLLFGATRLPQLGSSLGSAIRNFKKGFGGDVVRYLPAYDRVFIPPLYRLWLRRGGM